MTIFDRVNYGLLRQQKRLLVEMVDNGNASNIEANAINGVVSLPPVACAISADGTF